MRKRKRKRKRRRKRGIIARTKTGIRKQCAAI
jgi:hypothetical protein